jgi:hypothetical protein
MCFPACGASPIATAHALPPVTLEVVVLHWQCVSPGGVGFVAVVMLVWPLQSGHWVQQLSLPFFPVLAAHKGLPQALSATVLPACLWTFLLRCRLRPYTPLFLLGIGFQLEPVRSPQAFLKWGLVTASLSILLHPSILPFVGT